MYKQIILTYLLKYLEKKNIFVKKTGHVIMVKCPICNTDPISANVIPNTHLLKCFKCNKEYSLLDIARHLDFDERQPDEETLLHYLKEVLKINVMTKKDETDLEEYLDFYVKNGFDLVPIAKNDKIPIEKKWTQQEHKNKEEWKEWLANNLNMGIKTGIRSNITVIDIDALTKVEKAEIRGGKASEERKIELLKMRKERLEQVYKVLGEIGNPIIQDNLGGEHLIYLYEESLPKTFIKVEGIHLDIENDGGYILIYPSKLPNSKRNFRELKDCTKIPENLLKLLKSKIQIPKKTYSEGIREDIQTEDFKIKPSDFELKNNNLEGCCNNSFIRLGGILRKQLNTQQTGYVLHTLNRHLLENPMDSKAITNMVRELDKYVTFDEEALAEKILDYLKDVEEANRTEIAMAVVGTNRGEDKKRVDKALKYLVQEEHVIQRGTKYELIREMNWSGDLMNVGVPVNFVVPYFHDWAHLNWEDLILIGSQNKYGKTTLAMNIVKRLVDQGITPDYIFNESGGRYAKVALKLGMKNDDFYSAFCADPEKIILRKNKVIIFDWVRPKDFAKTDSLFSNLVEKVKKTHGFMICFVQLRTNNEFFAKDQIGQFPALVSKYIYNDGGGTDTKFLMEYVREAKIKGKKFEIPASYDWGTNEVKTIYEIEKEKNNND